jgi:plastocyanin
MLRFISFGVITGISLVLIISANPAFSEELTVNIPFGAYDPTFETPVDNWYEPPVVSIIEGDTVTWINDDREGHTITSGEGPGRFGWIGGDRFGEPDGFFDSGRFLQGQS